MCRANEKISVIVAAYNAEKTIERCINSLLKYDEVAEVIVVDDASSDQTSSLVEQLQLTSNKLNLIKLTVNSGPASARNAALAIAKSDWIGIIDADDYIIGNRFKKLLDYAEKTGSVMVADNLIKVLENEQHPEFNNYLMNNDYQPFQVNLEEFILSNLSKSGENRKEMGFIKPIIRRSIIEQYKIQYTATMRLGEDYDLYVHVLSKIKSFIMVPACGYVAVVRSTSLSANHSINDLQQLRDCNLKYLNDKKLSLNEKKALQEHYLNTDCRLQWRIIIDAVKNKNILQFIRAFIRPLPVVKSNINYLLNDLKTRSKLL